MTAVPVIRTFVAGEVVLASYFNTNINGPLSFLLAPPICQARQTAGQSLTNGAFVAITMTSEDVDSSGMHSTVSNTSRLTAVYPGWYHYDGAASVTANATGRRLTKWQANAADIAGSGLAGPATAASFWKGAAASIRIFQNVGDFVELLVAQESGGTLNTSVATTFDQSYVSARFDSN